MRGGDFLKLINEYIVAGTYSKHNIRVNVSYPSTVDGIFKTVTARFWHI